MLSPEQRSAVPVPGDRDDEVDGPDALPTIRQARRVYRDLPEPTRLPCGDFRALVLGPPAFRTLAAVGLTVGGLPRWVGKRFRADGSGVNLLHAKAGDARFEERLPMRLSLAASRQADGAVVRVGYDPAAPWPWPAVVDELKPWPELGPDVWLGMARTDWPLTRSASLLRLPFLLLPLRATPDQRAVSAGAGVG